MAEKWVYFFGNGKAEGNARMKEILGGKGANLAEMTNLGIPVPPGFTIATKAMRKSRCWSVSGAVQPYLCRV